MFKVVRLVLVFCALSGFAVVSLGREGWLLCFYFVLDDMWLIFLTLPWVGLQCAIVASPTLA